MLTLEGNRLSVLRGNVSLVLGHLTQSGGLTLSSGLESDLSFCLLVYVHYNNIIIFKTHIPLWDQPSLYTYQIGSDTILS